MSVVFVLLAASVLFAVVVVSLGKGDLLDDDFPVPDVMLPEGGLSAADIEELRFAVAPRGYRMDQVDTAMDRLGQALAGRDDRIAELESKLNGLSVVEPGSEGRSVASPGSAGRSAGGSPGSGGRSAGGSPGSQDPPDPPLADRSG